MGENLAWSCSPHVCDASTQLSLWASRPPPQPTATGRGQPAQASPRVLAEREVGYHPGGFPVRLASPGDLHTGCGAHGQRGMVGAQTAAPTNPKGCPSDGREGRLKVTAGILFSLRLGITAANPSQEETCKLLCPPSVTVLQGQHGRRGLGKVPREGVKPEGQAEFLGLGPGVGVGWGGGVGGGGGGGRMLL